MVANLKRDLFRSICQVATNLTKRPIAKNQNRKTKSQLVLRSVQITRSFASCRESLHSRESFFAIAAKAHPEAQRRNGVRRSFELEARGRIELPLKVLQTFALPLGDRAETEGQKIGSVFDDSTRADASGRIILAAAHRSLPMLVVSDKMNC